MAAPRTRLALGVALVVVLATAWFVVGRGGPNAPGGPPRALSSVTTPTVTTSSVTRPSVDRRAPATAPPVDVVVAVPRWVPADVAATCRARGRSLSGAVVDCTPGRGIDGLLYRAFASVAALRAAYASEGTRAGGGGPSACAQGTPEERSWSAAGAPARPAGRYRCSRVVGRARLVWTDEAVRVLGVATRADGDLRSLYQWWTTVPGPTAPR
jgi:hypothetical protein